MRSVIGWRLWVLVACLVLVVVGATAADHQIAASKPSSVQQEALIGYGSSLSGARHGAGPHLAPLPPGHHHPSIINSKTVEGEQSGLSLWISCCAFLKQQWASLSGQQHQHLGTKAPAGIQAARKLLAQQSGRQSSHQLHGAAVSSIAVIPALAFVLFMVAGRLRWLLGDKQPDALARSSTSRSDTSLTGLGITQSMHVDAAIDLEETLLEKPLRSASTVCEAMSSTRLPPARPLLARRYGWKLSSCFTTPLVGHVGDQELRFGAFLGSGTSGRVWAGTWADSDVAIKVLLHDGPLLRNPQQQLQQLVALNHPNIVRTFMGVTFTRQNFTAVCKAMGDDSSQLDAASAARSGSALGRDQHAQQQLVVLTGPPSDHASGMHADIASPDPFAATAGPSLKWGGGASRRASDSSAYGLRPVLEQQLQRRARASSLTGDTEADGETWLVQEHCDLGSLHTVALEWQIAGEGDVQMWERLSLLLEVARGLKHLHSLDIVHGDLNAHNVLICKNDSAPTGMTAKVTDMGLCCTTKQHARLDIPKTVRSMSHVAPEQQRFGRAGFEADIYSFGIMMWEVFTGQAAYRKLLDAAHLYEAIVIQNLRPKIPPGMPADYQLLMERCWASDPADRPPVEKLVGCLAVMAAERNKRINPDARHEPTATPAAAAAVAIAAARSPWGPQGASGLVYSSSCDQGMLQRMVHQPQQHDKQQQLQQPTGLADRGQQQPWRAGEAPAPGQSSLGRLAPAAPGSGLLHHKSCPQSTFDALLRSGSALTRSSDSDASESDKMESADAIYAMLEEEEEMLLQLRATSQTRSGPGSAPLMHFRKPQPFAEGFDMTLFEPLDDNHTWHI